MEKKIFLIGVRKITSEKKHKDYYMVDYIIKKDNIYVPKTDYINLEEYNKIGSKIKSNLVEVVGVFDLNNFNQGYLCDIK